MSHIVSLDQADFCQPEIKYDEMSAVSSVIQSIQYLENEITALKNLYQQRSTVEFTLPTVLSNSVTDKAGDLSI